MTIKCNDLNVKLDDFGNDKKRLEQANHLLDESVKVAQGKPNIFPPKISIKTYFFHKLVQKDMICDEQDKIQNLQLQEISNLKNLLLFREQESIDRIAVLKQSQQQAASLKTELMRIKDLEPMLEDAKVFMEFKFKAFFRAIIFSFFFWFVILKVLAEFCVFFKFICCFF